MSELQAGPSYDLLATERGLTERVTALIQEAKPFSFDIETGYEGDTREEAQLHPEENFIAGISFTNSLRWARYVPMRHDSGANLDPEWVAQTMWPLMVTGLGVPHGGQFELRCMSRWFREYVPEARATNGYFPIRSDTMLEAHAEGRHRTVALKPLTLRTFNHQMAEILSLFPGDLTKFQENSIRFSALDQHDPAVYEYACEDSLWTLAHHYKRYMGVGGYPAISDPGHPQHRIYQIEMAILYIVCGMEETGLCYDWAYMRDGALRGREFQEKLSTEISADLSEMLGEPVKLNIASPKQVATVLYDRLHLPVKRRSRKTNNPSTDKIALKGLSKQYPVVQKIVDWKQLAKLCGTYLETYERKFAYCECGRSHPHHMQCGVPAGRFAVSGPPYQQSPKKYHYELSSKNLNAVTLGDGSIAVLRPDQFNFNFRNAIICPPGYYGFGFDYSQIELRVLAGEAGETALVEAFARGEDVHKKTASLMLSIPLEQITDDHRGVGKTMNFALGYQMGVDGLADRLGITKGEAQDLFDQYFMAYSHIKDYMAATIETAARQGYVLTKFGRRVPIWEFESAEVWKRREGERLAGNAPIQGGAADYMKIAMVRADQALRKTGLIDRGVRLVMNIHDALEWYVPYSVRPGEIINALTKPGVVDAHPAILFPVEGWPPMVAEWHAWEKWGSAKELEVSDDGAVRIKGERDEEFTPGEEDEDGPSLPAVDLEAMRRARGEAQGAGAPDPGHQPVAVDSPGSALAVDRPDNRHRGVLSPYCGPARTVIIQAGAIQPDQFRAFMELLEGSPGPNSVLLKIPGGAVPFRQTCGLSPDHLAEITLALGQAEVTWDPDSVDGAAVAQGAVL